MLATPWSLALYLAACLALALHMFHGGEAAHRSLGLLRASNANAIRIAARVLAVVAGGGFLVATLALALPTLAGGTF